MKRSVIIFIISFLITAGACTGLAYWLKQNRPVPQAKTADTPKETAPVEEASPMPAPSAPEPNQPPAPASEEPTQAEAPPALPSEESAEKQQQEKPIGPFDAQGGTPEKNAVCQAANSLLSENAPEEVQRLVRQGLVSPQAAEKLLQWAADNKVSHIEEVGDFTNTQGEKITRFRMKAANGSADLLVDVVTDADGRTRIQEARETQTDKTQTNSSSDSMTVAEGFVEAVKRGNMAIARRLVKGSQVSDATVAGLCMIFEEGAYDLRPNTPIRNTFQNEEHSGYLVYVVNKESSKPGNIGLEMTKDSDGWHITAVALDSLLSSYEDSASAEGGRYFPIVKNPKGGDSLALFFAFNKYDLTPRSLRQLGIVADLLKQSHGKLNISGHTDDVGSEQYNLKLSQQRADAVKKALVSFGVQPDQISTEGLGKSQPRRTYNDSDTESAIDYIRGENRRAEIYLDFE